MEYGETVFSMYMWQRWKLLVYKEGERQVEKGIDVIRN